MAEREAAKAGLRAAEGASLRLAKRNRRAKRALAQRQGQCLLKRAARCDWLLASMIGRIPPADAPPIGREPRRPDRLPLAGEPQRLAIGAGPGLARMRVPEVDLLVVAAAGRRPAPVRAEGRGEHDIVVAGIGDDLLAAGDVVDVTNIAALPLASARQQELAIRAEAQGAHLRPLPGQHAQKAPVACVPQPDFAGEIAAGDGAIRGHGKAIDLIAMAGHVRDLLAIGHAPEPQVTIERARHRAAAIGAEANGVDLSLMPFEPVQQLRLRPAGAGSYPGVPENGGAVGAPEISQLPSGEKARLWTTSVCPFNSATSLPLANS